MQVISNPKRPKMKKIGDSEILSCGQQDESREQVTAWLNGSFIMWIIK